MIRRTLALAGVAALAAGFTGLAGPAGADPGITDVPDLSISEVGTELVDAGALSDIDGSFIEIRNNTTERIQLQNHEVLACTPEGSLESVVDFVLGDEIAANSTVLIAGPDFNHPSQTSLPDKEFEVGSDPLEQVAGGVQLLDSNTPVDDVKWGMTQGTDCASFFEAGSTPTDAQSLNRVVATDTWALAGPTPEPSGN